MCKVITVSYHLQQSAFVILYHDRHSKKVSYSTCSNKGQGILSLKCTRCTVYLCRVNTRMSVWGSHWCNYPFIKWQLQEVKTRLCIISSVSAQLTNQFSTTTGLYWLVTSVHFERIYFLQWVRFDTFHFSRLPFVSAH